MGVDNRSDDEGLFFYAAVFYGNANECPAKAGGEQAMMHSTYVPASNGAGHSNKMRGG